VNFDGKTAQEVFDSLGPDLATTCSGEAGDRARQKKGIMYTHCARCQKQGWTLSLLDRPQSQDWREHPDIKLLRLVKFNQHAGIIAYKSMSAPP
jgi:hypothetical protein